MTHDKFDGSPWQIVLLTVIGIVLLAQGAFLFRDAQKRGRHAWFWGIWGLIHFPDPILVYYFFVIRRDRKRKKI